MKQVSIILGKLLAIAQNTRTWLKVLVFIIVSGATFTVGAVYFSQTKVKPCEDCGFFKTQNEELIQALINIKADIKEVASSTNYIMDATDITFMYASYDTVPKKKQTQQQIKLGAIDRKIDSILRSHQQKQQQQKSKQ